MVGEIEAAAPPKVIALIRFSYISDSGDSYVLTRGKDLNERVETILNDRRLEKRFDLFEKICLPSLKAQDPNAFAAILLCSELLPGRYADRLVASLSAHSNLHAVFEAPGNYGAKFQDAATRLFAAGNGPVASCRLDDDDALSADFSTRMCEFLRPDLEGYCVSLTTGVEVERVDGEAQAWEKYWVMGSAGLALIAPDAHAGNIYYMGNHARVCQRTPTIIDAREVCYLQTIHSENDSVRRRPQTLFPASEIQERYRGKFDFLDPVVLSDF